MLRSILIVYFYEYKIPSCKVKCGKAMQDPNLYELFLVLTFFQYLLGQAKGPLEISVVGVFSCLKLYTEGLSCRPCHIAKGNSLE